MIKKELEWAGRFDDLINLLDSEIIESLSPDCEYPIDMHYDSDGKSVTHIHGLYIIEQAREFRNYLLNADELLEEYGKTKNYEELYRYASSYSNMLLHNYAVALSHRDKPSVDMDYIRIWEILDNLIGCLDLKDEIPWHVPNGWRRKETS